MPTSLSRWRSASSVQSSCECGVNPNLLFQINPSSGVPIYRQLMDQVRMLVATGRLAANEMLPSVRQIAEELQVNPMTVSKAYSLLELDGVIERVRGQGMRVLAQTKARSTVKDRQQQLQPLLQQVAAQAFQLGLTREQVVAALNPLLKDLVND
jgi:GntR family transcriptional regulator